ncbi:MAG: N-6 DNA methylase [Planctomycetaceae bacterium]|jgi:type I restriction-modification system DNA methylase subunit|nr:N-6 DNA methylase [Planctomycetaceae bacterium]
MSTDSLQPLKELIEQFRHNLVQYKSAEYDESNTRTDFIDKFFEILGWDVRNTHGYSENYRDVIREDRVEIDHRPKAPDYAFRIGRERKFFVEAKKPAVNIHDEIAPAFQLRRYGYTAKLPLSILTDFEEFAVYDTRIKPHKNDKASIARVFYCKFTDYLEKSFVNGYATNFDYICNIFSKESVLKGGFDQYAESTRNKRGTDEVDQDLLELIEQWRQTLAKNIAKQNPQLDTFHLNLVVQRIIDRILFLRIAEDRHIEHYEDLFRAAKKKNVYNELLKLFIKADDKYNAGIFKHENWFNKIIVPNKVLTEIITNLYYPDSPYAFSELPIEILGSIYERFLGKTIRLTASHNATVEEKPEVRKSGGVYYTPQYIVDYIVRETVGRKLNDSVTGQNQLRQNQPKQNNVPAILDPACGSGSFLVGAYTFLLDYYLDFYCKEENLDKSLKTGLIYEAKYKTYRLSIDEKQRILLSGIFGVDIDPIAVEVTKLSLYLKLLENETEESQPSLFSHKYLPDLDKNIRCGNSLIESDFYTDKQLSLFDDTAMRKINAFDWQKEFPPIFKNGGFDCVIGNPPYVLIQGNFRNDHFLEYYRNNYSVAAYKVDLYHLFLSRGIDLLRSDGMLGVITPSNYFSNNGVINLRRKILNETFIVELNNIHGKIFHGSVNTALTILSKKKYKKKTKFIDSIWITKEQCLLKLNERKFYQNNFQKSNELLFTFQSNFPEIRSKTFPLGNRFEIHFGMQLRNRQKFPQDVIAVNQQKLKTKDHKPCYTGKNVQKWRLDYDGLLAYFNQTAQCGGCWDEAVHFANPKIIVRQIGTVPVCALDQKGYCCLNTVFMIVPKTATNLSNTLEELLYLLAILNSKLVGYYWQTHFSDSRRTFPKIKGTYLKQIPIPIPSTEQQHQIHNRLIDLANQMLATNEKLYNAISESDKKLQEQRVLILDREIDTLVYKLYGLNRDDIEIIEKIKN